MAPLNLQLVYPMFGLFFLIALVLSRLFYLRQKAVRSGAVKLNYYKTYSQAIEPESLVQASRHFSNLFEAPVLFFVVCILGMIVPVESPFFVVLAWLYVAARAIHAWIHMGRNKVLYRMQAYFIGWIVLAIMWLMVLFKTIIAG